MSLEDQIAKTIAALPSKPRTYIVRPAKPRGGKKRHAVFGLMVEPRRYQCTACGNKQLISTNHTDNVFEYCQKCSWTMGKYPGIDFGGRRYRSFKYIGRGKLNKNPHAGGGKKRHAFSALEKTLKKRPDVKDASALAAWLGMKKLGKRKFLKKAALGRKRAAKKTAKKRGRR